MMTLEDQIDDLREQVAYWKAEAEGRTACRHAARFQIEFGLSHTQAWILSALYDAKGDAVHKDWLQAYAPGSKGPDRCSNAIQVLINRLRENLGAETIETVKGIGYRITPIGISRCNETLLNFN